MLQNIDCKYIKVDSATLTTVLGQITAYQSIKLSLKKNCCTSLMYDAEIVLSDLNWNVEMFKSTQETSEIEIKYFYVKNIITGIEERISLGYGYDVQNCTEGFGDIQNEITDWLTARGIIALPTFDSSVNAEGVCVFSIIDLPAPYVMTRMVYAQGGADYEKMFTYSETAVGMFISGDKLYISPEIISEDLTAFTDGIYTVEITYLKKNNSTVKETSCLFMDCSIKCQVAAKLDTLTTDSLLHIMYFALVEASNCACQCDKMCRLYEEILIELGLLNNTTDCGCN